MCPSSVNRNKRFERAPDFKELHKTLIDRLRAIIMRKISKINFASRKNNKIFKLFYFIICFYWSILFFTRIYPFFELFNFFLSTFEDIYYAIKRFFFVYLLRKRFYPLIFIYLYFWHTFFILIWILKWSILCCNKWFKLQMKNVSVNKNYYRRNFFFIFLIFIS